MIKGIALLLSFQLLGESLVFAFGFSLPGPVMGVVFLFVAMQSCKILGVKLFAEAEAAADGFLSNLGLLFVPAGVGIVGLWGELNNQISAIIAVLVASAVLTLIVTVWTFVAVKRFFGKD